MSAFGKKASIQINVGAKSVYDGIGVGFFTGGENVFSIKKFLDKDNAIQAGLGWDIVGGVSLSADYLFNNFDMIKVNPGTVICYWGLGLQGGFSSYWNGNDNYGNRISATYINFGLRVPFGISYIFHGVPVDITLQLVPGFGFVNGGPSIWPTGGLGARYYF